MDHRIGIVPFLIIITLLGALVGWIASRTLGRNAQMGVLANIVVGIIGALIVGYALYEIAFNLVWIVTFWLATVSGAVILLFMVSLVWPKNAADLPKPEQEVQSSVSPKIQQKVEKQSPPKASAKKVPSGNIFLSYRRTDSADVSGRIYDRLLQAFGKVAVFKDVDSIPLGLDFKEYLDEKVSECSVLLAVIGDKWLEASDSRGRRRLEDPRDFVRLEIESALKRDIPVIPLLVRGASMPTEEQLPDGLKKLSFRNGTAIRPDPDFHRDMDRVISHLKNYVKPKR